jgi:hypothetical protein
MSRRRRGRVAPRPRPFEPHAVRRSDDADAFFPDPDGGPARVSDDLAETLGESFIEAATTGEDVGDEVGDQVVPEEVGGPFVEAEASREFADDVDEANPEDAEKEPLPRAVAGLVALPPEDED